MSEVSTYVAGVQSLLKGPGNFWVLMLKYSFSHILETLFLSFMTPSSTPKTDKNGILHCSLINLRYFYIIIHFAKNYITNLDEKVKQG